MNETKIIGNYSVSTRTRDATERYAPALSTDQIDSSPEK